MDNFWERSIPFYNLQANEMTKIFNEFKKGLTIFDFAPINVGCRNSNYKVRTDKGTFLLRICPPHEENYKKEEIISKVFSNIINVPELYFVSENNFLKRAYLIYDFIDGVSMQHMILNHGKVENDIIRQVAESAAYIHNSPIKNEGQFYNDYPPFLTWYDLFLKEENVLMRLGDDLIIRIKRLIENKKEELSEIDKYNSFIHSDFRPANMIVDKYNKAFIVDFEYSVFGHTLADIGQFFRYSKYFLYEQFKEFEEVYNSYSAWKLPPNWIELSKLRDLVNPLQMLGEKQNLPNKYADLKEIVIDTLEYFNY